ncbi:hypothetical protein GNI_122440 [Gregarina niphandrodes]|uniref:Uncharacterized protein n=1 Tax=Gregarina niphandrodes TaxID=110365 RepID=A0A023B2C7_GRENI|nr:hypothetical protein GNI_122440 [Gregarina niphandrodes]EZG52950.1 hypothetical protein GNI_122440 [Gregarina niphandrodes]|eukprot:XP_011131881.1 hypothetical protein GNI_122440 [Gregarina niphandrodes]
MIKTPITLKGETFQDDVLIHQSGSQWDPQIKETVESKTQNLPTNGQAIEGLASDTLSSTKSIQAAIRTISTDINVFVTTQCIQEENNKKPRLVHKPK